MFDTYTRLSAPFDVTFRDVRGGVEVTFISGEQVVSRLNEVLGVAGWSFRVLRHDINPDADEAWALGELVAEIDERTVVRQQFGSQKLKRSRSTGAPLDLGFDLKGASTDAMKKCASLLGVGLYLSRKEPPPLRPSNPRLVPAGANGLRRPA
ncbi:MAG: RAD52 family DNA repair protein [Chloroflexota bacterium]|nr:RAD52 family DNA repair protein [Chloroflexota bacterium]